MKCIEVMLLIAQIMIYLEMSLWDKYAISEGYILVKAAGLPRI